MKKAVCILAIALVSAVLISGCVSTDPPIKEKGTPAATPRPSATSGSGIDEQEKRFNFNEPTFIMRGTVTYEGYSAMSSGPEYSIDLLIQSVTNHPVSFNKIVAKYNDQGPEKTVESNINRVTLNYGQAVEPKIETYNLRRMQDNVEAAGKKTIVIHIQLKNDGEYIGGDYEASLPPLFYMEKGDQVHRMDFALNATSEK